MKTMLRIGGVLILVAGVIGFIILQNGSLEKNASGIAAIGGIVMFLSSFDIKTRSTKKNPEASQEELSQLLTEAQTLASKSHHKVSEVSRVSLNPHVLRVKVGDNMYVVIHQAENRVEVMSGMQHYPVLSTHIQEALRVLSEDKGYFYSQ